MTQQTEETEKQALPEAEELDVLASTQKVIKRALEKLGYPETCMSC